MSNVDDDDDTIESRAHVFAKYFLCKLLESKSLFAEDECNKYISYEFIIEHFKDLIPPSISSPDSEYYKNAYSIYLKVINYIHLQNVNDINKQFKIDIEKYLHGFKILFQVTEESAYGTLYYILNPEYVQPYEPETTEQIHNKSGRSILKIQTDKKTGYGLEYETFMQEKFFNFDLAPQIHYTHHILKNKHVTSIVIMKKYTRTTLSNVLKDINIEYNSNHLNEIYQGIIDILKKMCNYNLIHGDLHWGNVGIDSNVDKNKLYKYSLLDFGQSSAGTCDMRLELLQLLRTIRMFDFKPEYITYLEDRLYDYYKQHFDDGLVKHFDGPYGYEIMHSKAWSKYMYSIYDKKIAAFMKTFNSYDIETAARRARKSTRSKSRKSVRKSSRKAARKCTRRTRKSSRKAARKCTRRTRKSSRKAARHARKSSR